MRLRTLHRLLAVVSLVMVLGLVAAGARADIILLDFGANAPVGTEVGPAGVGGTWQQLNNSMTQTLAGGEALQVSRGDNNDTTHLPWPGSGGSSPALGTVALPAGSIMATEPAVFGDTIRSGDNGRTVGFRLSGLAPGTYDVYMAINPSTEADSRVGLGVITAANMSGSSTVDGLTQATIAYLADARLNLAEWTASGAAGVNYNYIKASVTIASESDYVVGILESARGAGSVNSMGISAIQIIPEPATMALLGLGGLAALIRRRRA